MYDELVKRLREVADEVDSDYDADPYNAEQRCLAILQAADAIEELEKIANELLAKYQEKATSVIGEYSWSIDEDIDRLNEEVRILMAQINGMPLPQPPKEE